MQTLLRPPGGRDCPIAAKSRRSPTRAATFPKRVLCRSAWGNETHWRISLWGLAARGVLRCLPLTRGRT